MAINFKENVSINTGNLLRWRERYSKEEYPSKVILNLFYDLVPLKQLWEDLNDSFEKNKFNDFTQSLGYVNNKFREIQFSIQPHLIGMLKEGVVIGGLKSKSYDNLVQQAKSESNVAAEEIEFAYITRNAIKATFITWYALGLMGNDKEEAYQNIFSTVQYPFSNWNSFEAVLDCFAKTTLSEISGMSKQDGTVTIDSIYNRLPNLWD